MGGIEEITVGFSIYLLAVYPLLKRLSYPVLIPKSKSFLLFSLIYYLFSFLDAHHYALLCTFFPSCSTHTEFVCGVEEDGVI